MSAVIVDRYEASITRYSDGVVVLRLVTGDGSNDVGYAIPLYPDILERIANAKSFGCTSGFPIGGVPPKNG